MRRRARQPAAQKEEGPGGAAESPEEWAGFELPPAALPLCLRGSKSTLLYHQDGAPDLPRTLGLEKETLVPEGDKDSLLDPT